MRRVSGLRSAALLVIGLLINASMVEAQQATPGLAPLPTATAPFGLGRVILPADASSIGILFARLPDAIGTEAHVVVPESGDRLTVAYGAVDPAFGPPLALQAINFTTGDFFPKSFTASDFVATAASSADYGATAFGRDGTLVWVRAESTAGVAGNRPGTPTIRRPIFTLAWGESTEPWLFTAIAFTPEGLATIVSTFVTAANGPPGTPAPDATPLAGLTRIATRGTGSTALHPPRPGTRRPTDRSG